MWGIPREALACLLGGAAALLSFFSPLILLLSGLALGWRHYLLSASVASILTSFTWGTAFSLRFLLLVICPGFIFCLQSLRRRQDDLRRVWCFPERYIVLHLMFTGLGVLVVLHLSTDRAIWETLLFSVLQAGVPHLSPEQTQSIVRSALALQSGVEVLGGLFETLLCGVLAQRLLLRFGLALRPADFDLSSIVFPQLPRSLLISLGGFFLAASFYPLGKNIILIMLFPFAISGLSFFHWLAQIRQNSWILFGIYAIIFLFFPLPLLLIAVVGVVDYIWNIRRKISI